MSIERIKEVTGQILARVEATRGRGEEATKQALVLPMLSALGYDIWDPREVCPEYEADFAIKKAGQKEKVDIAVFRDESPIIYIETKSSDCALDGHQGQLARYFNATQTVVLGILTNGVEWRFFTDTTDQNVMDDTPFHVARLDSIDQGLDVMARFIKGQPIIDTTRTYATELRYTAKIAAFLKGAIDLKERNPDEELIRWILKSEDVDNKVIYSGIVNGNVVARFTPIVKNALTRVIRDIVRRSVSALDEEVTKADEVVRVEDRPLIEDSKTSESETASESTRKTTIITTADELDLFEKVKTLFELVAQDKSIKVYEPSQRRFVPATIGYKDTSAYFGIYINKPSWWFLRASVESISSKWSTNWLGFDLPVERVKDALPEGMKLLPPSAMAESRVVIESIEDVYSIENIILMAIDHEVQRHQSSMDSETPVQI
jgi:Uncharacterized conserved protein